jgi:prolyl oligopeptidase
MGATDHIPYAGQVGAFLYNFWQDKDNRRGLWRPTTMASYRRRTIEWGILLDVDAFGRSEGEDWVFNGTATLSPKHERWLIALSRGGLDACVTREFDLPTRQFRADGVFLPESKRGATWLDARSQWALRHCDLHRYGPLCRSGKHLSAGACNRGRHSQEC